MRISQKRLHAPDQALGTALVSIVYETSIMSPDGQRHDVTFNESTLARAPGRVAKVLDPLSK
jgi:hypothetical protein